MGRSGIAGGFLWVYLNGVKSISHGAFAFKPLTSVSKPVAEHLHHGPGAAI